MKLFDLHSDTLYEAYHRGVSPLFSEHLQAPLGLSPFEVTHRIAAIWCDNTLDDESAWQEYLRIYASSEAALIKESLPDFVTFDYAVEDARLLAGKLDRLMILRQNGTKVLTLMWQGLSSIGGAWDTDEGLTDFGKAIVQNAPFLGITLDISHASEKAAKEVLKLSERSLCRVIATHSNSFTVCPHRRNLSDYLFDALAERSSPVGISMVPSHLSKTCKADFDTILSHIAYFLKRKNAENILAIGSDFDGVSTLPEGISSLGSLPAFYRHTESLLGKALTEAIFWRNAHRFFAEG